MSRFGPKGEVFGQFALVAKAMGHRDRIELVELLAQGERSVEALARSISAPVANVSQHLQQLKRAGLVTSRREGRFVVYRLTDDSVVDLIGSIRVVAERNLAEIDRIAAGYYRTRDEMEPVSAEELLARMQDGAVTVLDVRPAAEYAMAHLPEAINIPLAELEERLDELHLRRTVVAYCRGPYCVFSYEAVALLRRNGFEARRLRDGLPEWQVAGLPIVQGATMTAYLAPVQ